MDNHDYFAQAVSRELEAEAIYYRYIDLALVHRDLGASDFFYQMAESHRLKREAIMQQADIKDVSQFGLANDGGSYEDEALQSGQCAEHFGLKEAMEVAFSIELRSLALFKRIMLTADDGKVRGLAEKYITEQYKQILAVERYMGRQPY